MNIFLVGMMGAGKSSVGSLLASELKYEFVALISLLRDNWAKVQMLFSKYMERVILEKWSKKSYLNIKIRTRR